MPKWIQVSPNDKTNQVIHIPYPAIPLVTHWLVVRLENNPIQNATILGTVILVPMRLKKKDLSFGCNALHSFCTPSYQSSVKGNLRHGRGKKSVIPQTWDGDAITASNGCPGQWKFIDPILLTIHGWVTDRCCKKTRRQGWLARDRNLIQP